LDAQTLNGNGSVQLRQVTTPMNSLFFHPVAGWGQKHSISFATDRMMNQIRGAAKNQQFEPLMIQGVVHGQRLRVT
jgi:hypothetical protein